MQAVPLIGSLVASSVLSKAMTPKMPEPSPTTAMPTPDDAQAMAAKRRKAAEIQARSGRMSTILTDTGSNKLGG